MFYPKRLKKTLCHRHPPNLKPEAGVVVVLALFIVALTAALSYMMMARLERDTHRSLLLLRNIQASFYAEGSVSWARDVLKNNWEQKKPGKLIDVMPYQLAPMTVNGYTITSTLQDMQARFNLNNLSKRESMDDFKRLLMTVDKNLSETRARQISQALVSWIAKMPQDVPSEVGSDAYYLAQSPPYRAAHQMLFNMSELKLVKGMTPTLFERLKPFIIALPQETRINIQTASLPVLVSLSPLVSVSIANVILQLRAKAPFVTIEQFFYSEVIQGKNIPQEKVTVESNYFLLETQVNIEKQPMVFYTLLEREVKGQSAIVNKIWQTKGSF